MLHPPGRKRFAVVVPVLAPNLWWRCGEGSGNLADNTGNGWTGTPGTGIGYGATGALVRSADTAITFDNTNNAQVASSYNPFANSGIRTYVCFAKRTDTSGNDNLWASSVNAFECRCNSGTTGFNIYINRGVSTTASATWTGVLGAAAFHLIALEIDQSVGSPTASLWVDGVPKAGDPITLANSTTYNATPGNFQFGRTGGVSNPLNGVADEILVFERRLTAGEHKLLYSSSR